MFNYRLDTKGVNPVICLWEKNIYLLIKPGLVLATMFISNSFILGTNILHNFVEVLLGCGINLHVDCATKLRAQGCQLLWGGGGHH